MFKIKCLKFKKI